MATSKKKISTKEADAVTEKVAPAKDKTKASLETAVLALERIIQIPKETTSYNRAVVMMIETSLQALDSIRGNDNG